MRGHQRQRIKAYVLSTRTPLRGKSVFKYDRVRLAIVHSSMKIDKVVLTE